MVKSVGSNTPFYTIPTCGGFKGTVNTPPSGTIVLNNPLDKDTFGRPEEAVKQKSNKLSTVQKAGVGVLGTLGTIALAAILFAKHQSGKLTKLYNEKMQLVDLAKHIDFKEAATVDEGIKFAKEVLKINEVGEGFTLDAINYANRGLVDVANANKGHLFMPKKICFEQMEDDALAYVIKDIESNRFGELAINKNYFKPEVIDKNLKDMLYHKDGSPKFSFFDDGRLKSTVLLDDIGYMPDDNAIKLIKKFYNSPDKMSINEKRNLWNSWRSAENNVDGLSIRSPLMTLEKYKDRFKTVLNKDIDIEAISKKSTEEQSDILLGLTKELCDKGHAIVYEFNVVPAEKTLYHEMGHLQDFAKNLKELDVKHWKLPSFKECWNDAKEGKKHVNSAEIEHVDNRWGGLTYDGYSEFFEKSPNEFKKKYPDLYEFLTNQQTQQTAGKVSHYAQTSIGEFIADTYAKMIRGDKLPDDVIALYKKYNGPAVPFS